MADVKIVHSIESEGSRALVRTDHHSKLYRDIDERRRSLTHSIAQLRHAVSSKLDVKRHAGRLVNVGKDRARDALSTVRTRIKQRPALTIGVGLGLLALGAAGWVALRRARPPHWKRTLNHQLESAKRVLNQGVTIRIGGAPEPR